MTKAGKHRRVLREHCCDPFDASKPSLSQLQRSFSSAGSVVDCIRNLGQDVGIVATIWRTSTRRSTVVPSSIAFPSKHRSECFERIRQIGRPIDLRTSVFLVRTRSLVAYKCVGSVVWQSYGDEPHTRRVTALSRTKKAQHRASKDPNDDISCKPCRGWVTERTHPDGHVAVDERKRNVHRHLPVHSRLHTCLHADLRGANVLEVDLEAKSWKWKDQRRQRVHHSICFAYASLSYM